MNLGTHYKDSKNKGKDINLSEFYLLEGLKLITEFNGEINPDTKIMFFKAVQELYNEKKDYKKAIEYGQKVLSLEKLNSMPYIRRVTYMVLAKSYLGIKENDTSQKYLDLFSKLNDSIVSAEKDAVEVPIKKIISETKANSEKNVRTIAMIAVSALVILTVLFVVYKRRSNRLLHQRYTILLEKLKTNKNGDSYDDSLTVTDKASEKKLSIISDDTLKAILKGLIKFEMSDKYLRKDMNIVWLSNHLNTNTKCLSDIIKNHKEKNFNSSINSLRIEYITKKLYSNPIYRGYKITYLAEECGYASSQVFVLAFKKETGVTPSYFIENLKK